MTTIINIMKSLVDFNGYTVKRFELQGFVDGTYVGYLYIENNVVIKIHEYGTFEAD